MVKKTIVPDAWDDDWEAQADKAATEPAPAAEPVAPKTKSERLALHTESNRKLWESAETPQSFYYPPSNSNIPAATMDFKPQVKVLSRKPVIAKRGGGPSSAMGHLSLEDDDDEPTAKKTQLTSEEIKAKQKRDLEEKQRRYEEARAKIFGESAPSSGASTPGTVTPPRGGEGGRGSPRGGRGRGRGGRGTQHNPHANNRDNSNNAGDRTQTLDNRRQNFPVAAERELYDPNYSQRPDAQRREDGQAHRNTPKAEQQQQQQQPIRTPRGPDGSGRGGFGFARGSGKAT